MQHTKFVPITSMDNKVAIFGFPMDVWMTRELKDNNMIAIWGLGPAVDIKILLMT